MTVHITIPAYNEEVQLRESVSKLHRFLCSRAQFDWEIVIADNASIDRTPVIARELAQEFSNTRFLRLAEKGRGRALKTAWMQSQSDILSYMDVDLSSDLDFFPQLVAPLIQGRYDLSTGSRLLKPDWVKRGWKRQWISKSYNRLIKLGFQTQFSDAQCGFKAIARSAAHSLLPLIGNDRWFFDTELLILAEKLGYKIFDLPIRWQDDPNSTVNILSAAAEDLQGLFRLKRHFCLGHYKSHLKAPDSEQRHGFVKPQISNLDEDNSFR